MHLRQIVQLCWNVSFLKRQTLIVFVPVDRLHLDEIDNTRKVFFGAYGQLNRNAPRPKTLLNLVYHAQKIRTGAIHLVNEDDSRHLIFIRLPPDGLRLWLNARSPTKHHHSPIQNPEAPFDFNGEINVSGRIDDIDAMLLELVFRS